MRSNRFPVYLGVTLDRTLSFAQHAKNVKAKIATRNNLLGKLANSSWGANPETLRTTALALSYSAAEYCCPVWARSSHASKIDPELNKACRTISGTLKATPLPAVYRLAGIAPPQIRRDTNTRIQKHKQEVDPRHALYNYEAPKRRLKSRRSFMTTESLDPNVSANYRLDQWRQWDSLQPDEAIQDPREQLPTGTSLSRRDWVTLNRARAKVGRTGKKLLKWGLADTSECPCGNPVQTMEHILRDCKLGPSCTDTDLLESNTKAKLFIQYWRDKI